MARFLNKKMIAAFMTGVMLASSAAFCPSSKSPVNVYADELEEAETKKAETQEKKEAAEQKLKELESGKNDLLDVIEDLDNEISSYEGKINALAEERNKLQVKAAITESNMQNAFVAEANQYDSMKERIQFAYENGDAAYIDALLSIKEYSSVVNQSEYVSKVSEYDQTQLNDLMEIETVIADYQSDIQYNLSEIEILKSEAEGEQEALQVMQVGKQETLEEYNKEISETEYSIEELEQMEAEQDSVIAAIEAEAEKIRLAAEQAAAEQAAAAQAAAEQAAAQAAAEQAAAQAAAEQAAAQAAAEQAAAQAAAEGASPGDASYEVTTQATTEATTQATTEATTQAAVDYSAYTIATYTGGGFTWPMPSSYNITSPFGMREIDVPGATSNHRGVDISCPSGSSVVAAADGIVIYTGYMGTAGNAVLISHGNGITTMYYHLSAFNTSVGANVYAGQTIAYSGNTGASSGPHLHFGVRINGTYVDPMNYF
ncbi:MAG: peptidoglycan DD-metalloendopeptidase family protein [Eubacterium sp.]|nr:peptidoglycan DD-metalloendopeptidase family protein [Eubacterium sp.]